MDKNKRGLKKIGTKARMILERSPYVKFLSFVAMIATIIGVPYGFGRYHMAAQMEREFNKELREMNYQHREELTVKEKECDEWKEKYFILLNASNRPANNSP